MAASLTRRSLGRLMAGAFLAGAGALSVRIARAATGNRRLVVVILRGGLDGLAAVPAYADRDYRQQRGALAIDPPGKDDGALDLDGRFGLHPALKALHAMYRARELAVFHAVATPYRARSHFDGQDLLENGTERARGAKDGWLNRALGLLGPAKHRLGLAVGQGVPLILRGDVPVGAWAPAVMPKLDDDFLARLAELYRTDRILGPALREGLATQAMSDDILGEDGMAPGRRRDAKASAEQGGRRRYAFPALATSVGRLLAAPDGARVAVFEVGGWDTHANQGVLTGRLAVQLQLLSDGLDALKTSLGPAWAETVVAVITEFGRTVAINGTGGTDHGTASIAVLAGGAVAGGRVYGSWPGLAQERLFERRDLAPKTDLRAVLKGVLAGHLGLPADAIERVVFPDSRAAGLMRDIVRA